MVDRTAEKDTVPHEVWRYLVQCAAVLDGRGRLINRTCFFELESLPFSVVEYDFVLRRVAGEERDPGGWDR